MARMTKEQKANKKAKYEARCAKAREIVATGVCPECKTSLRRNRSMTGWFQCGQYGAVGFRADSNKPSCSFQIFTE